MDARAEGFEISGAGFQGLGFRGLSFFRFRPRGWIPVAVPVNGSVEQVLRFHVFLADGNAIILSLPCL